MAGIFDGLEKFGLGDLKKAELFEDKTKKGSGAMQNKEKPLDIKDYLFSKDHDCPVCGKTFSANHVRTSKLRLVTIDYDLRPIYEPIDPLFYDVISCIKCGYSSVKQQFDKITDRQVELIDKQISTKFTPITYPNELTVDMAIERYKLVLVNALVKRAKNGEKAYICMKIAWLFRIKGDKENELLFIKQALEGFATSLQDEYPPIMGLEEPTIVYLLAAFSKDLGMYNDSLRYLSELIVSKTVSNRLKERARDLKEEIKSATAQG